MQVRKAFCAVAFCALILNVGVPAMADPPGNADYKLDIGGFYHGTGTGSIHGNILDLTGTVTTDDGTTGALSVTKIHVKGNHFTAQGTICGHTVTVDGRFDQPPAHGRGRPGTGRLTITFSVDDGHDGRIVGLQNP